VLNEIITTDIYRFLLLFTRIGVALMIMPGFGGITVQTQIRLVLALSISFIMLPVLGSLLPPLPRNPAGLLLLIFAEAAVGFFLGVMVQVLLAALDIAGSFVGFQIGMTNAFSFDAISQQQSQLLSAFLANIALVVIFAADLHHLMLRAVADSYALFPPGQALPLDDFSHTITTMLGGAFALGIKMSAPILVFGLTFYSGLGLLSRLVPQLQVFFIAMPVQLLVGMWMLMVALPLMMTLFMRSFEAGLIPYLTPR